MISKILNLVNSVEFQELNSYYNEKTMFNALNVERNENRHSAFIAWWLNPKSEHGLGDAPLKLFLRLVATKGWDIIECWQETTIYLCSRIFRSRRV